MKIYNNFLTQNPYLSFEGQRRKDTVVQTDMPSSNAQTLTPKQRQIQELDVQISDLLSAGYTTKEVSEKLNIKPYRVLRTAKKYGLPLNKNQEKVERDKLILQKIMKGDSNKKIMEDLKISSSPILKLKRKFDLTLKYNKLETPQVFSWTEIVKESKRITEIREMYQRFKKGERTKEILEEMSKKIGELKIVIDNFKNRVE